MGRGGYPVNSVGEQPVSWLNVNWMCPASDVPENDTTARGWARVRRGRVNPAACKAICDAKGMGYECK